MNINVILRSAYNLDRVKRCWSYRSLCACTYCVYVDSYSFSHSLPVYCCLLGLLSYPWDPPSPLLPLLLLLIYHYPPFDVSHIPSSATLIVFCNYFHSSAIVTCSICTALNKLVPGRKHVCLQETGLTCELGPLQVKTCHYALQDKRGGK